MVGYVFPFRTNPAAVNHKQICVTDRYESVRAREGTALGIQDTCRPSREVVRVLGPPGFRRAAAVSADRTQTPLCIAGTSRASKIASTSRPNAPIRSGSRSRR